MSFKRSSEQARLPRVTSNLTYPAGYDRKKKEYCRKLIAQLQEADMISDIDINIFFRYTTTKFMMDELDQELAKVGVGNCKEYKELLKMYTSLSTTFIALSKELGLTPRNNRLKSNIDKRQALDVNLEFDEDEEVDLSGWTVEEEE